MFWLDCQAPVCDAIKRCVHGEARKQASWVGKYVLVILSKCCLRCWYLPGLVAWENISPSEERRNSASREPSFTFPRLVVMQLLYSASVLEQNHLITGGCTQGHWIWECCVFGIWHTYGPESIIGLFHGSFEGPAFGCCWLYGLWPEELTEANLTDMLLTWLCSKVCCSLGVMTAVQMRFFWDQSVAQLADILYLCCFPISITSC